MCVDVCVFSRVTIALHYSMTDTFHSQTNNHWPDNKIRPSLTVSQLRGFSSLLPRRRRFAAETRIILILLEVDEPVSASCSASLFLQDSIVSRKFPL
jgi:hypothetical protein